MITFKKFYEEFYGSHFSRFFRRPHKFGDNRNFRINFPIYNPNAIVFHVKRNSGHYPCMISTYDNSNDNAYDKLSGNPEKPDTLNSIFLIDRIFFDFDVSNSEYKGLKDELENLRVQEIDHNKAKQREIQKKILKIVIYEKSAEKAVEEVKIFANLFKSEFGKYPILFFSGSKGAHAYCFFKPVKLTNPNYTIYHFVKKIKEVYEFETLDLSVNKDAITRLSRIPYSMHQITGLTVVPFNINESYGEIIKRAISPCVKQFDLEEHITNLGNHLEQIDEILHHNKVTNENRFKKRYFKYLNNKHVNFNNTNHQDFFKEILGEPTRKYPTKEYVIYHCPFPDHPDEHPSFMVHKNGYKCYGCNRKGNYWQFYKDYYGWNDSQVRNYLKNNRK